MRLLQWIFLLCLWRSGQAAISLSFVIGGSGAMETEVAAVRTGLRLLRDFNSPLVSRLVLVAFGHSYVDQVVTSNDLNDFENGLTALSANRSGKDCPKMAIMGLMMGLHLSQPNSLLFFLSDAPAKDFLTAPLALKRAHRKNITMNFIMSGCCAECKPAGYRVFEVLAKESGGRLFRIPRLQTPTFMNFVFCNIVYGTIDYLMEPPSNFTEIVRSAQKCIRVIRERMLCLGYSKQLLPGINSSHDRISFLTKGLNDLLSFSGLKMEEISSALSNISSRLLPPALRDLSPRFREDRFLLPALRHFRPAHLLVILRNNATKMHAEVASVTLVPAGMTPLGVFLLPHSFIKNFCQLSSGLLLKPSLEILLMAVLAAFTARQI